MFRLALVFTVCFLAWIGALWLAAGALALVAVLVGIDILRFALRGDP